MGTVLFLAVFVAAVAFFVGMVVWPFVLVGQMRTVTQAVPVPASAELQSEWHTGWYEPALGPLNRRTCRAYHVRYGAPLGPEAFATEFVSGLEAAGFVTAPAAGATVAFVDPNGDPDVRFIASVEAASDGTSTTTITSTRFCEEGFVP